MQCTHGSFSGSKRVSLLAVLWLGGALACTGGRVTKAGASVSGADVSIWTCDSLGDYRTKTDTNGVYTFNPYSPTSDDMIQAKYVPEGPIAILVTSTAGSSVTRRDHDYDEVCDIKYDNAVQSLPCKRQDVALVPMTFQQFNAATLDFLEDDCGLSAQVSPAVARELATLNPPPERFSCISGCVAGCGGPYVPYGDFLACMCICVEASCGASYGPGCVEATPTPR